MTAQVSQTKIVTDQLNVDGKKVSVRGEDITSKQVNAKTSSRIGRFFRQTWKLNLGEHAMEEFHRDVGSTQRVDRGLQDDRRFNLLDKMVERAFTRKGMKERPILYRERQFLRYYQLNQDEIHTALRTTGFFHGRNDYMIESLVVKRIREIVNVELFGELERMIAMIDFRFLETLSRKQELIANPQKYFVVVQKYLLANRSVREQYIGPIVALRHGFVRKYLEKTDSSTSFIEKSVFGPLTKRMTRNEIVNLARISILMQSSIYLAKIDDSDPQNTRDHREARSAYSRLKEKYPSFPDIILKIGLLAAIPYDEKRQTPAMSQYCAIISGRCEKYVPSRHHDRGAKGPDESWFSITAKNSNRRKYNPVLLSELKSIAARCEW